MEFHVYDNNASADCLLSDNSKTSWSFARPGSDSSMEHNTDDEFFAWNQLKIDEDKEQPAGDPKRKRKLIISKDPLALDDKQPKKQLKAGGGRSGGHWDDYNELNAEIDNSLADLANNPYSDAILQINNMTVFKQEAPSPSSNEITSLQNARQSPTSTQQGVVGQVVDDNNSQTIFNNTINQLLSQSGLVNLQNVMEGNQLSSPNNSQDNYSVTSTNYNLIEDFRFQYVLAAATSIATKQNEDTLTYLNQGQSYEIKLKKLGDLSMYRGKSLKSMIRICFHERRLQYMEKEQMTLWQKARPGDRILEVDVPLSYGAFDIVQPSNALNVIQFSWDPTKEVGIYIKVNCISTEFTPKKHGGEKGVPFRIQVETYQNADSLDASKRLHAAACQIKVFKLKGADRKHKQDREKILKRPVSEQEKYQPSYECTVLNDIPNEAVLTTPPIAPIVSITESPTSTIAPQTAKPDPCPPNAVLQSTNNTSQVQIAPPTADKKTDAPLKQEQQQQLQLPNGLLLLSADSGPQETVAWLTGNRFDKYLDTFCSFSGADMLRMNRDDLIQICGQADGIRLYNSLHLKSIAPKLKIYVCRDKSSVFNAIFLSSYNNLELLEKLGKMLGIAPSNIRDIYMEGPQNIHIQLTNDVLGHVKEETMFNVEIIAGNSGSYVLLLKQTNAK